MRAPLAVYCDFDGTVTQDDVIDLLLEELADPQWKVIEAQWVAGKIGSRECLAQQIPLIRGGWSAVAARLRRVKLAPTFPAFASWCRANQIPLYVVSDGLDRVIHTMLSWQGISVDRIWANHVEEGPSGALAITFPHPARVGPCPSGLCKCRILAQEAPGTMKVVVGDGRSDLCWATAGDWLFAKSDLLRYCRRRGIPCTAFQDFETIQLAIEVMLGRESRESLSLARR